ncbi:hypothetical protein HBI56_077210 [Parastagonospora nodorum]|uniref:Uncharacterized protein n=1 Tax=Phaeosphaeria nodorum (strain SN15 / ATCC MYA-4574 / FGSC 10173) TaxID=321614 RepID=A0A7U2EW61_PHANO|nr:hypothetical protein HBH56_149980 [Parastagonospora nodorum]QRC94226.1 hypothetical protein JI435_405410 [Parastagonospora nodorum SN15]KAH3928335.1 hypothetical protein HBH54_135880 [Parastagonospora nodorum]KAH3945971.1 hypothetical protein HBH53_137430 [Parastagonospora nodorum]KAH3983684.1 hypothetical protein HBH52_062570 [Parastagonospora nodorum]
MSAVRGSSGSLRKVQTRQRPLYPGSCHDSREKSPRKHCLPTTWSYGIAYPVSMWIDPQLHHNEKPLKYFCPGLTAYLIHVSLLSTSRRPLALFNITKFCTKPRL